MSRLWTPGWTIHESLPGRLNDRKWTFVNLDGPEIANGRTIGRNLEDLQYGRSLELNWTIRGLKKIRQFFKNETERSFNISWDEIRRYVLVIFRRF